jgi:ankyrin repeat protein
MNNQSDGMPNDFFQAVRNGDAAAVFARLEAEPAIVGVRERTLDANGTPHRLGGWPTPLCAAAEAGRAEIVRLLLDHQADPMENARWGYPAVMHAAWAKHPEIVKLLLEAGQADRGAPGYGFGIDINNAASEGWLEIVQKHLSLDPLAVHRRGVIGETPLHWAAHNGHAAVCLALLEAGAIIDADEIGLYGGKPLHWAAEKQAEVVRLLLSRGADVNSRNVRSGAMYEGFTPLVWCASQSDDSAECARLLLDAGADPHATDAGGRNALDWARKRNAPRVADVLPGLGLESSE